MVIFNSYVSSPEGKDSISRYVPGFQLFYFFGGRTVANQTMAFGGKNYISDGDVLWEEHDSFREDFPSHYEL